MPARKRMLLLAGLLLFARLGVVRADCVPTAAQVVELELLACQPAEVAIGERIAGTELWWLRPYLDNVAQGNPGVVIRGKTLRFRELDHQISIFPWSEGDGVEEEFFFTSSDPNFCSTFEGLQALTLIREEPCCDMIPPPNVACVLDIAEVRAIPEDP